MSAPRALALALLLAAGALRPAIAAELKVLSAGAFKPVVSALAPVFSERTGHTLRIENDTAGALQRRIAAGERFDVVIAPGGTLDALSRAGALRAGSVRPLARVAIGVAVRRGSPLPAIGSVDAFRAAVLAAPSIAYIDPAAGGSSGVYLAGLFERLGLADAVRAKAVLVPGGLVAERVVRGEAELAIHQITEIVAVPGAVLVGPLPPEIQNITSYAGAVAAETAEEAAAASLLDLLGSAAARSVMAEKGMEPP